MLKVKICATTKTREPRTVARTIWTELNPLNNGLVRKVVFFVRKVGGETFEGFLNT